MCIRGIDCTRVAHQTPYFQIYDLRDPNIQRLNETASERCKWVSVYVCTYGVHYYHYDEVNGGVFPWLLRKKLNLGHIDSTLLKLRPVFPNYLTTNIPRVLGIGSAHCSFVSARWLKRTLGHHFQSYYDHVGCALGVQVGERSNCWKLNLALPSEQIHECVCVCAYVCMYVSSFVHSCVWICMSRRSSGSHSISTLEVLFIFQWSIGRFPFSL